MNPDDGVQKPLVPEQRPVSREATNFEAVGGATSLNGSAPKIERQDGGWPAYRVLLAVTVISAVPLGEILWILG
jgi:hypothetical protein